MAMMTMIQEWSELFGMLLIDQKDKALVYYK